MRARLLLPWCCAVVVCLLSPCVARALDPVEVRQPDGGGRYKPIFHAAFAPCVAPNTTTRTGVPACTPAVRSACGSPFQLDVVLEGRIQYVPKVTILYDTRFTNLTPECKTGEYVLEIRTRSTIAGLLGEDHACNGDACTFVEHVDRIPFTPRSVPFEFVLSPLPVDPIDPHYEIIGMTIFAPDGLPLFGTGGLEPSNLLVPYEPCTAPDPIGGGVACPVVPWHPGCDFESGEITWLTEGPSAPAVHATLRDLAGTSPLCTTGEYRFEASVRSTQTTCGTVAAPEMCTLVDRTIRVPLVADGRRLDATAPLAAALGGGNTEILEARLVDPTGTAIAAAGVTGIRTLVAPRIDIKDGELRLKATISIDDAASSIDPTLDDGFALRLATRDGHTYAVSIPGPLWQLRAPLGSGFDYEDPAGMIGGVRRVRLKRVKKAVGGAYGYKLELRAGGVDLSGGDRTGVTVSVEVARSFPTGTHRAQGHRTCKIKGADIGCK